MIIWQNKKAVFFHNPRTGGNSIYKAAGLPQIDSPTQHWGVYRAERWFFQETWDEYWSFSFVRNPWERYVSFWSHAQWNNQSPFTQSNSMGVAPNYSFDEWVYLLHNKFISYSAAEHPQTFWTDGVDDVFKYEERTAAVPLISERIGLKLEGIHTNQSEHGPYQEYYKKRRTIEIVQELDWKTIRRFGYKFGG
jgi:chondroitin 4-sulfotransferase 11